VPRDEIAQHVARHLGAPLEMGLRETIGSLNILVVPASQRQPWQTLVTMGMSEHAMDAPAGAEEYRHVELFMRLPPDWPLTREAFDLPDNYWPIESMRLIAHWPETEPVFLASEQTVGNSPPEPFAPGTRLSSMMLLEDPTAFGSLRLGDGRVVRFYQLIPLYEEERAMKERMGTRALIEAFQRNGVSGVIRPDRVNVASAPGA
jgi:Suppressor of fused protein (SUFU)